MADAGYIFEAETSFAARLTRALSTLGPGEDIVGFGRYHMPPFVLESFGAVGPSAQGLLYKLATEAEEDGAVS